MSTDCTAVKTQLLRLLYLTNTVNNHNAFWLNHILTITQAYWDVSGAEADLQNNSEIILKLI